MNSDEILLWHDACRRGGDRLREQGAPSDARDADALAAAVDAEAFIKLLQEMGLRGQFILARCLWFEAEANPALRPVIEEGMEGLGGVPVFFRLQEGLVGVGGRGG